MVGSFLLLKIDSFQPELHSHYCQIFFRLVTKNKEFFNNVDCFPSFAGLPSSYKEVAAVCRNYPDFCDGSKFQRQL